MKFSTTNAKCSSYCGKHVIYIGTHTGSFKKLQPFENDPYSQVNFQQIEVLDKSSKVTCMEFGNDKHSEILLGRANHFVKVFDCINEENTSCFEVGDGSVVGLGRSNGCIIAGTDQGTITINKYPDTVKFSAGENLSKLRICQEDQNLMVTGGKNLKQIIKVWDLEAQKVTFTAKNVKKDMLDLEQPVWENDVLFIDKNTIASCSRYGYVRVYDLRGPQRRPVQGYTPPDEQLSFTCLAKHDKYLYAGTTTEGTRAFDSRKMKNHIHVYKGFTGTVTSLAVESSGNYLFSASLDRYIRVHNINKTAMVYQCYVKSKPTQILCTDYNEKSADKEEDDDLVFVGQIENDVDSEYEDMFAKMQTVKDKAPKRKFKDEQDGGDKTKSAKRKTKKVK
ncbi:WD repeat-containing protein 74 isoform X2 [Toxorhynchites rutilus septentrionalis]|uniref:WD repeat-containing protein 74 isoform X2 n=1 Tax=Toxorhynchites rutilus septentrionalis TaxID=329112 RepID=UPI00247A2073|nr:WD repeat-containing protein 74 isoform X2 [Toxorhynchites rutilus septentrionalis]